MFLLLFRLLPIAVIHKKIYNFFNFGSQLFFRNIFFFSNNFIYLIFYESLFWFTPNNNTLKMLSSASENGKRLFNKKMWMNLNELLKGNFKLLNLNNGIKMWNVELLTIDSFYIEMFWLLLIIIIIVLLWIIQMSVNHVFYELEIFNLYIYASLNEKWSL